jgi:hypothetical protein
MFVVSCRLTAGRPKLGTEESLRVDVVSRQILCEQLIFFSAWHLSDEVFDKAVAYFIGTEKDETKDTVYGKC